MPRIGRVRAICLLLAGVTLALYWPATRFEFINHDDPEYVMHNSAIQGGVTAAAVKWAFGTFYASNWHPVTWISHMLDVQKFGLNPGGHHLTNVVLHTANTVLLFLLLRLLTGAVWRSAIVAGLFAWHPLHVESVAWVSERKDVLSGLFFMLTLWAWARYAKCGVRSAEGGIRSAKCEVRSEKEEEPGAKGEDERGRGSLLWYLLAMFLFALGLMSKPMLVTVPCLLLLLDYWPFGRLRSRGMIWRLVLEKLPFLVLSALDCLGTVWAQQNEAIVSLKSLPMYERLGNAAVAILFYLWKTVWPVNLSVLYLHPGLWPFTLVALSVVVVVVVSALVVWRRREQPWLVIGWFWFLGTLVPVIGVVQVGIQAMADRYMYLPSIGILMMLAWSLPGLDAYEEKEMVPSATKNAVSSAISVREDGGEPREGTRPTTVRLDGTRHSGHMDKAPTRDRMPIWLMGTVGAGVLLLLIVDTSIELEYWRNDVALFSRAAEITPGSVLVEYNLGEALGRRGNVAGAIEHYSKAIAMTPGPLEATRDFRLSAMVNLGGTYANLGQLPEAEAQFRACVRESPGKWEARSDLADVLAAMGRFDEALAQYRIVLRVAADNPEVWRRFGVALCRDNRSSEALKAFRTAVKLHPNGAVELNDLAWFLATDPHQELRNGVEAVRFAQRACELTKGHEPRCLGTLDAALAEAGRFDDAIAAAQQTQELAMGQRLGDVAKAAGERIELYRAGKAYRQQ